MGNVNHLKLVFQGDNSTSPVVKEMWEFTTHAIPTLNDPMPDIYTPQGDFDAVSDEQTTTDANYTATSNFRLEGGISDIDLVDYLVDRAYSAFNQFIATAGVFKDCQRLRAIQVYPCTAAGAVVALDTGPAKAQLTYTPGAAKGAVTSGLSLPMQLSVVIGKRSAADIPRGRGRIYPPPMDHSLTHFDEDTGLVTPTGRSTLVNMGGAFFAGIAHSDANTHIRPCIIGSPWTKAYLITSVEVGNVPDTQRRRRAQLEEEYTTGTVTYP